MLLDISLWNVNGDENAKDHKYVLEEVEDYEQHPDKKIYGYDHVLMTHFANKLKKESEEED